MEAPQLSGFGVLNTWIWGIKVTIFTRQKLQVNRGNKLKCLKYSVEIGMKLYFIRKWKQLKVIILNQLSQERQVFCYPFFFWFLHFVGIHSMDVEATLFKRMKRLNEVR